MTDKTMKAVGYVRVSTAEQAASGLSLEAQREKIRQWAALHDHELVVILGDEGRSGGSLDKRPALEEAREMLRTGEADTLVVARLDRLTRSSRDFQTLIADHFGTGTSSALASVAEHIETKSAAGKMLVSVLMTFAEYERDVIGERTRAALAAKQAKGEYVGAVPLGYRWKGGKKGGTELERCPKTYPKVERILRLHQEGLSLRAIGRELDMHHKRVGRVVKRARVSA